jgi:hypothetical protein
LPFRQGLAGLWAGTGFAEPRINRIPAKTQLGENTRAPAAQDLPTVRRKRQSVTGSASGRLLRVVVPPPQVASENRTTTGISRAASEAC